MSGEMENSSRRRALIVEESDEPEECAGCGRPRDDIFLQQFLDKVVQIDIPLMCRACKRTAVVQWGTILRKYCYTKKSWFQREHKRKRVYLTRDQTAVVYHPWPSNSTKPKTILLKLVHGVVFGASASIATFKRQKTQLPHWNVFSIITSQRTYDFCATDCQIIECWVLTLQALVKRIQGTTIAVFLKAEWSLGTFLWSRARFRLMDRAQRNRTSAYQELWIVVMKCVLQVPQKALKISFLKLANFLRQQVEHTSETFILTLDQRRIEFQKQRVEALLHHSFALDHTKLMPQMPQQLQSTALESVVLKTLSRRSLEGKIPPFLSQKSFRRQACRGFSSHTRSLAGGSFMNLQGRS